MAKKEAEPRIILEREYVVPLRREWLKKPKYKRAKKAARALKAFIAKHMKVEDRDVKKVKLDKWLNNEIWFRGIRNPPHKIKVKCSKYDNGIVKVELFEIPQVLKFKVEKEKKIKQEAEKKKEEKKETVKVEEKKEEETAEEKVEKEEKKEAVVEAGFKQAEKKATEVKHETVMRAKQPKHEFRQALKK